MASQVTGIDVEAVRSDTPGSVEKVHFNNAGASLMPRPVIDTVTAHLERELLIGGYEAADAARESINGVYRAAARLLNCDAGEIALLGNATRAWHAAFDAIPFRAGDRILTGRSEYCSNYMAYIQLARTRDVETTVIGDDASGQIDLEALRGKLDERVRLISLTHVPTSGGLVNPAAEVGAIAREADAFYLLDATQSVGQMPIDVQRIGCDFLATTGRKFLRAPRGTGLLYVADERVDDLHPASAEVGGASWTETNGYTLKRGAARFESWEVSYALELGLGRAIEYALDIGMEAIWDRVRTLGEMLRNELSLIEGLEVRDQGGIRCAIVTFSIAGVESEALFQHLRQHGFNVDVSTVEDSRLDFEARRLEPLIRASVHYFNTEDEIARFCEAVKTFSSALRERRR